MPLLPLFGHDALRQQLARAAAVGTLPQSLLLHGAPGIGKQRLALWLAQLLLCDAGTPPCGSCRQCRMVLNLNHPDLAWVFPHERPKDSDSDLDAAQLRLASLAVARAAASGLYEHPSGSYGLFVDTVRVLVRQAASTPALAKRKVFVLGDADRMVLQEGSEVAANAFLKLLEEPPANTVIILTTSALGALLPTIRSRVAAVRVAPVGADDVRAFVRLDAVSAALDALAVPGSADERVALASGAPGTLLSQTTGEAAHATARRFIDAAMSRDRAAMFRTAFTQGIAGARGAFTDVLSALTVQLAARARDAAERGDTTAALAASRATLALEEIKLLAAGNVNPQLASARLLKELSRELSVTA